MVVTVDVMVELVEAFAVGISGGNSSDGGWGVDRDCVDDGWLWL